MKLIQLTQGKFAKVDDEDYDFLMQWKWYAQRRRNLFYATRGYRDERIKNTSKILLHNAIMNPPIGMVVDHIDHDTLNNQKYNLRISTKKQNARNKTPKRTGTSKYLGVHLQVDKRKLKNGIKCYYSWRSQISIHNKRIPIKHFEYTADGEIQAAKAYDEKAKELFGEFANLNFK